MNNLKKSIVVCVCALFALLCVPLAKAESIPNINAKGGAILITADTGSVLYKNNENNQVPIASTTKIMSTILALEYEKMDEPFVVDSNAIKVEGSSMGLIEGDIVTMRDLCYGMLLPSGNDAANACAVKIAGSIPEFVKMMNERATMLGMDSTHFETPSGLDDDNNHYSTAKDMAILTRYVMANEEFSEIASNYSKTLSFGSPPYPRTLYSHNKLLKMYDGACGVKTGFTSKAGRCLVSAAKGNDVELIAVVLNDSADWDDSMALFDYGFSKVEAMPLPTDFSNMKLPVVGGNTLHLDITSDNPPRFALDDNLKAKVRYVVKTDPIYYAPVSKGDKIGEVEYIFDDKVISKINLYSDTDVDIYQEKASNLGITSKINNAFMHLSIIKNMTS